MRGTSTSCRCRSCSISFRQRASGMALQVAIDGEAKLLELGQPRRRSRASKRHSCSANICACAGPPASERLSLVIAPVTRSRGLMDGWNLSVYFRVQFILARRIETGPDGSKITRMEVSAYVSRQTRKLRSGGRRFDPDQLHQPPFPNSCKSAGKSDGVP